MAQDTTAGAPMNCECGCGEPARGATFLPGHDQKLRIALENRIGGLLALRDVVGAMESYVQGRTSLEDLGKVVRASTWRRGLGQVAP